MKKLLLIASLSLALVSCQKDLTGSTTFGVSKEELNVDAYASEKVVKLFAGGNDWAATSEDNWILVSPANGSYDTDCKLSIKTTQQDAMRTGYVTFTNLKSLESVNVKVTQSGFSKDIVLSEEEVSLKNYADVNDRYFEVDVTANVDFKIELEPASAGWVKAEAPNMELTTGYIPRKKKMRVNWNINTNPELERKVALKFVPLNGEELADNKDVRLNITQAKGDLIENSRAGDSLAMYAIARNLGMWYTWSTSAPMSQWDGVQLWTSKTVAEENMPAEAVGRVRSARFFLMDTKESLPYEVRYLKYVETLDFSSNSNQTLKKGLSTGDSFAELKHLKNLTIMAYGLETLDESLSEIENLESLSLMFNNFTDFPALITPENFPKLKRLTVAGNQVATAPDLSQVGEDFAGGLECDIADLTYLFAWENLETLAIGNNFIFGELPTLEQIEAVNGSELKYYTNEFFEQKEANDNDEQEYDPETYKYAYDPATKQKMILPNIKVLRLNLNRLTGELPEWLLYHPQLTMLDPFTLIFNQEGATREGIQSGFDNEPVNFEYFYEKYPKLRLSQNDFFGDEDDDSQLLP